MIRFYMDMHVRSEITDGLRLRGIDVLTAQEDGADRADDDVILDRATAIGRAVFTQDEDFLRIASQYQGVQKFFHGVIYSHQLGPGIGQCIKDLEWIAQDGDPDEFANRVTYLPFTRRR